MIIPIKSASVLNGQLAGLVAKVKRRDFDPDSFIRYMYGVLDRDDVMLLVNVEGDEIDSFVFSEVVQNLTSRDIFIDLAYLNPKRPGLSAEMMRLLSNWARLHGAGRITFLTPDKKRADAFNKRYDFKHAGFFMTKEVEDERIL